jgi:hypothetical protein
MVADYIEGSCDRSVSMRALLVSVFAAVLGVVAAWGATRIEFAVPEQPVPTRAAAATDAENRGGRPKIEVVGSDTWDFGVMGLGEEDSHVFTFRNTGTAPLRVMAGQPTCKCTVSKMDENPLAPGEERTVTLTWKPFRAEEKFRQMAPIETNDPDQPVLQLKIVGKVRDTIQIEPNPLNLGSFSPEEGSSHEVRVWASLDRPWKLQGVTYSDAALEPFFQLETRDMTQAELENSPGSHFGQVLTLSIKKGIPLGNVQQRLTLAHNYEDRDPIELRVIGKAVGDVTVLGKDYDGERDYVALGNVPSSQGKKTSLTLMVKGPHREQVKFKIKSIDPASSLRAELGEPTALGGKSVSWPLTIEIPPGAAPVNRVGSALGRLARIELDSGTPEVPSYSLQVRMAVTTDE